MKIERTFPLAGGGTVKVTVESPEPIAEEDCFILRPAAAIEAAGCLMSPGEAFRPH